MDMEEMKNREIVNDILMSIVFSLNDRCAEALNMNNEVTLTDLGKMAEEAIADEDLSGVGDDQAFLQELKELSMSQVSLLEISKDDERSVFYPDIANFVKEFLASADNLYTRHGFNKEQVDGFRKDIFNSQLDLIHRKKCSFTINDKSYKGVMRMGAEVINGPKNEKEKLIGENIGFERTRRITGYLVGTLDRFNNAKRSEERDRVKHGM